MGKLVYWIPGSELELKDAIKNGNADETHFLEFKASIPEGNSGNKELARDLASFSLDGGVVIVGVAESETGFNLAPIETAGLPERVLQVVQTRIEPRLIVRTTILPSLEQEGRGYLVIQIPASDRAPHMVENRYVARDDKTKFYLDHTAVMRLHEIQYSYNQMKSLEIEKQIARDPVPEEIRKLPHLYITATPRMTSRPLFLNLVRSEDSPNLIRDWLKASGDRLPKVGNSDKSPLGGLVQSFALRHDGIALFSGNLTNNRQFKNAEARSPEVITELEFSQEGQIRYFNGQIGQLDESESGERQPTLYPRITCEQVREFIDFVGEASKHADFGGVWDFSVGISRIAGVRVLRDSARWFDEFRYEANAPDYIAHTSGDLHSITDAPGLLTAELMGRLARSLKMEDYLANYFH